MYPVEKGRGKKSDPTSSVTPKEAIKQLRN